MILWLESQASHRSAVGTFWSRRIKKRGGTLVPPNNAKSNFSDRLGTFLQVRLLENIPLCYCVFRLYGLWD